MIEEIRQSVNLFFVGALQADLGTRLNHRQFAERGTDPDDFVGAVNLADGMPRRNLDIAVGKVDRHPFHQIARVLYGDFGRTRMSFQRRNLGQNTRAVLPKHSAEIEFCRIEQRFHLVIEEIDQRVGGVLRSAQGFVADLDRAVNVFEIGNQLVISTVLGCGQRSRFRSAADPAVDSVADDRDGVFSVDQFAALLNGGVERIGPFVQLIADHTEINVFQDFVRTA